MFHQVHELSHEHLLRYKSDIPLLLTLTVPNVKGDKLIACLSLMQKAWDKLMKRKTVKRVCRSWFRGLEVTYNSERDDYHPHYHVLIFVSGHYFERKRNLFIHRDDWLTMWQESTGLPEITQVDIRKVRKRSKGSAIESVAAEVAKYSTKPTDYVAKNKDGEYEANAAVVEVLHKALRRRRLVAFGGEFAKIRKDKKMQDVETANMVHVEGKPATCHCRICQSDLLHELYSWNLGVHQYVKSVISDKT